MIAPFTSLHGATEIGDGSTIGPHSTLIDATVGDGASVLHSLRQRRHHRRPGHRRAVLVPAAGNRAAGGLEGRSVRRGQELRRRRRHEGPASLLHRRRRHRREHEPRGEHDHRQLRRLKKHRTTIGSRVKTSVDTTLVAPVDVGDDAYTGAGSVITKEVPAGALGIARERQSNIEGYAERRREQASGGDPVSSGP